MIVSIKVSQAFGSMKVDTTKVKLVFDGEKLQIIGRNNEHINEIHEYVRHINTIIRRFHTIYIPLETIVSIQYENAQLTHIWK